MMRRREAICLLRSASVGALFAVAQIGLIFSGVLEASAAALKVSLESAVHSRTAQTTTTLSVPADSPRWDLQGQAKAAEYQGHKSLLLDGGAATLKD